MDPLDNEDYARSLAIELSNRVGKRDEDIEHIRIEDDNKLRFMIIVYKDGTSMNVAVIYTTTEVAPHDATLH